MFWVHLGVRVLIGLAIVFLAVTESILAFQPQIVAFAQRGAQIQSRFLRSPFRSVEDASDYRHSSATALTLFSDANRPAEVSFGVDSVVLVNACDGRVIGSGAGKLRGFFSSVRDLHRWAALNSVRH